jgi:hypothetical protein
MLWSDHLPCGHGGKVAALAVGFSTVTASVTRLLWGIGCDNVVDFVGAWDSSQGCLKECLASTIHWYGPSQNGTTVRSATRSE